MQKLSKCSKSSAGALSLRKFTGTSGGMCADHCSFSLFRASTGRTERTKHTRKSEHAHTRTHSNSFGTFYRRATVHLCIISSDALWLLGQSPCYSSLGSSSGRTSRVNVASDSPALSQGLDDVNNTRSWTVVFLFVVVKYLTCFGSITVWEKSSDQTFIMSLIKLKL